MLKTIGSVASIIDKFIFLDTGGEKLIIEAYCDSHKIPYEIYQESFIDASTSKNSLLDKCRDKSDYILLAEPDDYIIHPEIIPPFLKNSNDDLFATRTKILKDNCIDYDFTKFKIIKNHLLIYFRYPIFEQIISHSGVKNYNLLDTKFHFITDNRHELSTHHQSVEIISEYIRDKDSIYMIYKLCQMYLELKDYKNAYHTSHLLIQTAEKKNKKFIELLFQGYIIHAYCLFKIGMKTYKDMYIKAFEYSGGTRPEPLLFLSKCQNTIKYFEQANKLFYKKYIIQKN